MDNCSRENKNHFVFGFFGWLLLRRMTVDIKSSFLMVGHTHHDSDQFFSGLGPALRRKEAKSFDELLRVIEDAHTDLKVLVSVLSETIDFSSFIQPSLQRIRGIRKPLHFHFKLIDGVVKFRCRHFQDRPWGDWLPLFLPDKSPPISTDTLQTPAQYKDFDRASKEKSLSKFAKFMTTLERESWTTWFDRMESHLGRAGQSLSDTYFFNNSQDNNADGVGVAPSSSAPHSTVDDFRRCLPTHLHPLKSIPSSDTRDILRSFAPDFSEVQDGSPPTASSQPLSLEEPTYVGPLRRRVPEGCQDVTDLAAGDMVVWKRQDEGCSEDYPFWLSLALSVDTTQKQVRVRWYDKVPIRGSSGFSHWTESKWQVWWNVLTRGDLLDMDPVQQKRLKSKVGKPWKMSEEVLPLSGRQILYYNFQLTKDGRISKACAGKISRVLQREPQT